VHTSAQNRIDEVFAEAGCSGYLHAREIGVGPVAEFGYNMDTPVVLASVFKIFVALAFAKAVDSGDLDDGERMTVTSRDRLGGVGSAGCTDDVEMSLRDLALFMMEFSDNAATDLIVRRLRTGAIDALLTELELTNTRIIGSCEDLFASMGKDLGIDVTSRGWEKQLDSIDPECLRTMAVFDPARTSASTPREITQVLNAIWTDEAGSPNACKRVRNVMRSQVWPHRLASGFEGDIGIAAKTGTMPGIRNDTGVITLDGGRRFAVAVFTRAADFNGWQPAIDRAIGKAARIATDLLTEQGIDG
jgi:beta-lactamase class A